MEWNLLDPRLDAQKAASGSTARRLFPDGPGLLMSFLMGTFGLTALARVVLGLIPKSPGDFSRVAELIELLDLQLGVLGSILFCTLLPLAVVWLTRDDPGLLFGPRRTDGDDWRE